LLVRSCWSQRKNRRLQCGVVTEHNSSKHQQT
jgi:hypothetical protein